VPGRQHVGGGEMGGAAALRGWEAVLPGRGGGRKLARWCEYDTRAENRYAV